MICANVRQSELEKMGASALSKIVIAQTIRIEPLELQLAKAQHPQFGQKSEKMPHNPDQLQLGLDTSVIEAHGVTTPNVKNRTLAIRGSPTRWMSESA
jgi:transposase IS166 family protein